MIPALKTMYDDQKIIYKLYRNQHSMLDGNAMSDIGEGKTISFPATSCPKNKADLPWWLSQVAGIDMQSDIDHLLWNTL